MKIIYKAECKNCTSVTVVSIDMSWQISEAAMKMLNPVVEKNTVLQAQCCICKKPMELEFVKIAMKIAREQDRATKNVKEEE